MVRTAFRAAVQYDGGNSMVATPRPLMRECPRCGARPGWRCTRANGRYVEPIAQYHDERRSKRRKAS